MKPFDSLVTRISKTHRYLRIPLYAVGTAGMIITVIGLFLSGTALLFGGDLLSAVLLLLGSLVIGFVSLALLVGALSGMVMADQEETFYRLYPNSERPREYW